MAQRNPKILQILVRQITKNAGINVIFRKALDVLGKTIFTRRFSRTPERGSSSVHVWRR
jgi:hypothetical protein